MNIFGAFTFGSLIKTFLPGFAWLVAIVMLEADIAQLLGEKPQILGYFHSKDQAALVLAIPASLLLGLLSNVVVFMGVNDALVRRPVRRACAALSALYDELSRRIRERCWLALGDMDPGHKAAFDATVDPELATLHAMGVDKLAYVREQYWYHQEFQLNLLLSTGAVGLALLISAVSSGTPTARLMQGIGVLVSLVVMSGLLRAARKNYERHLGKMCTVMAVVLCSSRIKPADDFWTE